MLFCQFTKDPLLTSLTLHCAIVVLLNTDHVCILGPGNMSLQLFLITYLKSKGMRSGVRLVAYCTGTREFNILCTPLWNENASVP